MLSEKTILNILQDGKEYAIVSAEAKGEVPVNFKAKENGEYTLTVSSTLYSQLSTLSSLHLIDNLAGADIDLSQKKPLISGFFVEVKGVEPSSKQGTPKVSTCLFRCWFSCQARERTP